VHARCVADETDLLLAQVLLLYADAAALSAAF
jgi:hypothetical protein